MREQAALLNAPEGYLDFHDEYAELIAELAALGSPLPRFSAASTFCTRASTRST